MANIILLYPPGKAYQRSEDRAQCNLEDSAVATIHACNDLGCAAAVLRLRGHTVALRDYQTEKKTFEEVAKDLSRFRPDVMILSTTNATILTDIAFVHAAVQVHPCEVILKGAIFFDISLPLLETLDLRDIRCLIGGEMDVIIGDVVDGITEGKGNLADIPGILYRQGNIFRKTDFRTWSDRLDEIPFPARDLMRNDLYPRPDTGEPMATIQVARGCPSRCTYCLTPIISGKGLRKRSVENVFAEIRQCYYQYGIRNFFFRADTFTMDEAWAGALCDRILASELQGKIAFTVNSRAKPLSPTLLEKLKKAGCFMLAVGFESGSDETLKKIKKGTTRQDNLRAARMIKEAGLPLFGFFMIGFPWETERDITDTLEFMFAIDADFIEVHIAMPYYGTQLYEQCMEYGTIGKAAWGNDYFSPSTTGTRTVPMERIRRLRNRYLLKYYLRPGYIGKKLCQCLAKPVVLIHYGKHGIKLLKTIFRKKKSGDTQ